MGIIREWLSNFSSPSWLLPDSGLFVLYLSNSPSSTSNDKVLHTRTTSFKAMKLEPTLANTVYIQAQDSRKSIEDMD